MFKGYDFVYDGKSSISEKLKLFNVGGNAFEFVDCIPDKNLNLYHSNRQAKWRTPGTTVDEPLTFDCEFHLHDEEQDEYAKLNPVVARNRLSSITHWLFDQTQFKKLQILSDDMRDIYFMAVMKDVKYFEDGGQVRGFKCTVVCDTVGAWEEKTITKNVSNTSTFSIQVLQDGIWEVAPKFTIDMNGTGVTITVNGEELVLTNMTPGARVVIDSNTLIATSSEGEELYTSGRFNKCFPTFVYGKNTISITGNSKVEINYKMVRQVGC